MRSILPIGIVILAPSQGGVTTGLYRSTDFGVNWNQTPFNTIHVSHLRMVGNTILAGTDDFNRNDNGLYFSTDKGFTWGITTLNNNLHIDALVVEGDTIFAGTYHNGVYVSDNGGLSWVQKNEGLPNLPINGLSIFRFNNYVFAGIQYNGIYRREINELIGILPISTEIPNEFSLSQNYPNPFNPITNIEFAIAKQTHVSLSIYDIKGSLVKVLAEENLRAGKYSVDFNAAFISSGVYFYTLQAGDFRETRKMVLVK